MATTMTGLRYVRCPKCKKILTEFANVPVYRCGECSTMLRAKHYNGSRENIVTAPPDNQPQVLPACDSLANGSSSNNEIPVCASEDGAQSAASPNLQSSVADASNTCNGKQNELGQEDSSTKERSMDTQSINPIVERNDTLNVMQNDHDHKLQVTTDRSSNEAEEPSKLCQEDNRGLKLSDDAHDSAGSAGFEAGSPENKENHHDGPGNALRSDEANSDGYDGTDSSSNDNTNVVVPKKRKPESRRTFRKIKAQELPDTKAQREERVGEITVGTQFQSGQVSVESLKEKPHANEYSTEDVVHVSQDFEEFHSVQNGSEPERQGLSQSLVGDEEVPKGAVNKQNGSIPAEINSLERIQLKILRKVDQLREGINEIFDKCDEDKEISQLGFIRKEHHIKHLGPYSARLPPKAPRQREGIPRQHWISSSPSRFSYSPCNDCHQNRICRACHHDMSANPCNSWSPRACMGSRFPQHSSNPQMPHDTEKPHDNDRKQKKRLCRPILGGAPFVVCYNCYELLKLPIDFYMVRKRLYKLRCGACSEVLAFSFRARNYCLPSELENSASEVENSTDPTPVINDKSPNDPVSYSEDYGISLGISNSTEAELPEQISRNSSRLIEKRKGKPRTGSQLHLLMGYGSASELLYRHSDIDEESDFTEPATPHYNTPAESFVGRKAHYISDPSTSRLY